MKNRYIRYIFFALILLAVLGVILYTADAYVQITRRNSEFQQKSINNLYSTSIENKIREYREMLTLLAGSIVLCDNSEFWYADPEDHGVPQDKMAEQRKRLDDMIRINRDIYAVQLVDQHGRGIACEPYYLQQNISMNTYLKTYQDTDWFKGAFAANKEYIDTGFVDSALLNVYMSAPYTDELNGEQTIAISAPVRFSDGSIGVLIGRVSLKGLGFFNDIADQSFNGVSYIVNANGLLIASQNQNPDEIKGIHSINGSSLLNQIRETGKTEGQIDDTNDPITGEKSDIYFNYDTLDGWYFITLLDDSSLEQFSIVLYSGAFLFYLVGVASLLFWRRNLKLRNQVDMQKLIAVVADGNFELNEGLESYYGASLEKLSKALSGTKALIIDRVNKEVISSEGQYVLPDEKEEDSEKLMRIFAKQKLLQIDDKGGLSSENSSDYLSSFCKLNKIRSAVFYGLLTSGYVAGIMVIPSKKISGDQITLLESVGVSMEQTLINKFTEQQVFVERGRLRITLESIGDGVLVTNNDGKITIMNKAASAFTGYPQSEAVGRHYTEVFCVYDETGERVASPIDQVLQTGEITEPDQNACLHSRLGKVYYIDQTAAPIKDENANPYGVVLVFRDITQQKLHEKEILYLNYHDNLTKVYNRNFFDKSLSELEEAGKLPISIIMGDVNGLKLVNDAFGHEQGDKLLQSIANVLQESCRPQDMVIRWGGDEFIMVMPNADIDDAAGICENIAVRCEEYNQNQSGDIAALLSISTGYATKSHKNQSIMMTIKQAEDFMYNKKLLESRSLHNSILSSIQKTLNEKSLETEEHAARMQALCRSLGKQMRLSEEEINELELLALLHDIGKIAISDSILGKPGDLTPEEWVQMKRHCEIGYRMAMASPEIKHIANYILTHHERWNGTGYPQGLAGENIPLLSRILSVVDAYDAMTNDRVYRKKISKEKAIAEIFENAGKQFDPRVVEQFVTVMSKINEDE